MPNEKLYVIKDDSPTWQDPTLIAVGDSKGVYDNLNKEQYGEDRTGAFQLAVVKSEMRGERFRCRWCPHDRNPSDPLTKFRGAHAYSLHHLLKNGRFRLAPEADELDRKRLDKEAHGGYASRPRAGMRAVNQRMKHAFQASRAGEFRQRTLAMINCAAMGDPTPGDVK